VLGLFRFSRDNRAGEYRTPLFPITPILYVLITAVTLVFIALKNPVETAIGIAVAGLGIPVYHLVFKRRHTQ
jgi:APA family basic amino acid/polyamine antiporter